MKLIVSSLLLCVLSSSCALRAVPRLDETYENKSLGEAQAYVPFSICLPTYLPTDVEPIPQVNYHSEFGDPNESDVSLIYFKSSGADVVVEIYQRHSPQVVTPNPIDTDIRHEAANRALLAWVVGWPQVDDEIGKTSFALTEYESEDLTRELFEITSPASLSANMIEWKNAPVFYRVYTHLAATDAQSIADSLTNCLAVLTPTPLN